MIDHLICDCDGVLVDSEVIADRVMLGVLMETFPGIDFEPSFRTAFGQQTSRFLAGLETQFGIAMPPNFVDAIEARVSQELAQSVGPIAGVRDAGCRSRSCRTAAWSACAHRCDARGWVK